MWSLEKLFSDLFNSALKQWYICTLKTITSAAIYYVYFCMLQTVWILNEIKNVKLLIPSNASKKRPSFYTLIRYNLVHLKTSFSIPKSRVKGHMFIASLCLGQSTLNLMLKPLNSVVPWTITVRRSRPEISNFLLYTSKTR